jgi:hypothetical protein
MASTLSKRDDNVQQQLGWFLLLHNLVALEG